MRRAIAPSSPAAGAREAREVALGEDRCRRPTTRYGGVASRAQHGVGRAEPGGWRTKRIVVRQRLEQRLDLLGEVARDDDDPLAAGGGELVHERHDDGPPSIGSTGFGQRR